MPHYSIRRQWYGSLKNIQPFATKLLVDYHLSEVLSRYREPQLQVGENYSYLFNLRTNINILQILMFKNS